MYIPAFTAYSVVTALILCMSARKDDVLKNTDGSWSDANALTLVSGIKCVVYYSNTLDLLICVRKWITRVGLGHVGHSCAFHQPLPEPLVKEALIPSTLISHCQMEDAEVEGMDDLLAHWGQKSLTSQHYETEVVCC